MSDREMIERMAVIEDRVRELYLVFAGKFSEDAALWNKLADEEKVHGEVLRDFARNFRYSGMEVSELKFSAKNIEYMENYLDSASQKDIKDRKEALAIAQAIEDDILERDSFSVFNTSIPDMKIVFTILDNETRSHSKRISEYIKAL